MSKIAKAQLRVYPSSRFFRAGWWMEMKHQHYFIARWLRSFEFEREETPQNSRIFWRENFEDIQMCDVLLAYAEPDDILGGMMVEAGMAMAWGKPIVLAGENEAWRSWINWHNITKVDTIEQAWGIIDDMTWEVVEPVSAPDKRYPGSVYDYCGLCGDRRDRDGQIRFGKCRRRGCPF